MSEVDAVSLLAAFQIPALRDALMVNIIDPNLENAEDSGNLLIGTGIAPDWSRVDKAQARAQELIPLVPHGYRAPLLSLIGWINYLEGSSSAAA